MKRLCLISRGFGESLSRGRLVASSGLILGGVGILGWALWSSLEPPPLPFDLTVGPATAASLTDFSGVDPGELKKLEIRTPDLKNPIATGVVWLAEGGRPTPLSWRNAVTEPVFFAEIDPADSARVLSAIREHVPADAVILSWWDMSRRIRAIAGRQAPLDDPLARGLLTPAAWSAGAEAITEKRRAFWGAGVPADQSEGFGKFIDALLMDEAQGATALAELADGKEAFVAVHLADIWKAAAARPDLFAVAYKDFAGGGDAHGVMKAAREWMQENRIEGGFAVEPMGAAMRVHYLPQSADGQRLLALLLPFSTSNPLALQRFELVFQHRGYWIYRLKAKKTISTHE
ncbi:MAG: hydroxylamine oxidation protein HaoB [Methylocystis sp.]